MSQPVDQYNTTYSQFGAAVSAELRQAIYGEDIGQNSWLTADEYRTYAAWLHLTAASHVLEVGCGSGGPALFLARTTGAQVTGVDVNEHGIAQANRLAQEQRLAGRVRFQRADASQLLPFAEESFDAVVCIDTINHLPDRLAVLGEWRRVLKPDGRLLFTDPVTVTGLVSNEELAVRSSIGYFLFAPPGEDARLLRQAGFTAERQEDTTQNMALISGKRVEARARRRAELIALEGEETFLGLQRFNAMVQTLASERRLSRYTFLARKGRESEQG
jgi:SAM-dependent methyltransferase